MTFPSYWSCYLFYSFEFILECLFTNNIVVVIVLHHLRKLVLYINMSMSSALPVTGLPGSLVTVSSVEHYERQARYDSDIILGPSPLSYHGNYPK